MAAFRSVLLCLAAANALVGCAAFRATAGSVQTLARTKQSSGPLLTMKAQGITNHAAAASIALALAAANPVFTPAAPAPALVQQYGGSMIADEDISDAQKKFLEERAMLKTKYEEEYTGNYKSAEEVKDKKSIYTLIVGGLVAVAFIAPMLQYLYYTMGE